MSRKTVAGVVIAAVIGAGAVVVCRTATPVRAAEPGRRDFVFTDVCEASGLKPHLVGALHHAVAWGDVDGDGRADLFLGNFDKGPQPEYGLAESIPNGIFRQTEAGAFEPMPQPAVERRGRASGAALADLDNDGDLDLFVGNNNHARPADTPAKDEPSRLYRNDGGRFVDVTDASGAVPQSAAFARDVGVFDFDADGLLDLLVLEDRVFRQAGSTRLYRNLGNMKFADATRDAGLPGDLAGFGLAVADLNADGRPDFLVCGDDRLFLSRKGAGGGGYVEAEAGQRDVLKLGQTHEEEWQSGAAFGDLDLDGDMDLITGVHFAPARVRVFLNDGAPGGGGEPRFRDVTRELGVPPLPNKAPSCQIEDFDHDGLPDLYWSAWFAEGERRTPFICRGLGVKDGLPRFDVPSVEGLDTSTVRANVAPPGGRGMVYYVNGPAIDYDADGDLDFFAGIWPQEMSHLFRNDTPRQGNWLAVRVEGKQMNRMGIGAVVKLVEGAKLVGHHEITINGGYSGSRAAAGHFGLGGRTEVDVEVRLPGADVPILMKGVKANQVLVVKEQ